MNVAKMIIIMPPHCHPLSLKSTRKSWHFVKFEVLRIIITTNLYIALTKCPNLFKKIFFYYFISSSQ